MYVPVFGILGATMGLQVIWSLIDNFTGLIVFLDPENHDVDTKITVVRCIIKELWPFQCFGGHLENYGFPDVGFWGTFSMLFLISNTTKNRWKTFCSNLLGVRVFFYRKLTRLIRTYTLKGTIRKGGGDREAIFVNIIISYFWFRVLEFLILFGISFQFLAPVNLTVVREKLYLNNGVLWLWIA